jgi:hypothetical protein
MFLVVILGLVILGYLIIKRHINPDPYFSRQMEPIEFSHIFFRESASGLYVSAELEDDFASRANGKIQYSINNGYALYNDEYRFEIDSNNIFKLFQLKDGSSMVLGTVVDKTFMDYSQSYLYKIKLPEKYLGTHEYARGIFPYYVPVKFSMMSSGGNKYSHEERTLVISPQGDTLRLYQNYGHMNSGEKTGIYKR